MDSQSVMNATLVGVGALILLCSIIRARALRSFLPYVVEANRIQVARMLAAHRLLMKFFLVGYILVLVAPVWGYATFSRTLVATIFLFGSVFVFISMVVQNRLLSEMQGTLQDILPICSCCKRIRTRDDNPDDPKTWQALEEFMTDHARVHLTHGYCPSCQERELARIADA